MESSTAIAIASGLNIMVLIIIDRSSPMSPYMHDNNIMQSSTILEDSNNDHANCTAARVINQPLATVGIIYYYNNCSNYHFWL